MSIKGPHTVIHPSCHIGQFVVLQRGIILQENVKVWHNTLIRDNTVVEHDAVIGDHVYIGQGVTIGPQTHIFSQSHITAYMTIKEKVFIGPMFCSMNDPHMAFLRNNDPDIKAPCILKGARIAARVTVMPGVTIGENAVVGANSLVTKDIPEGELWFGQPARFIKKVSKREWL